MIVIVASSSSTAHASGVVGSTLEEVRRSWGRSDASPDVRLALGSVTVTISRTVSSSSCTGVTIERSSESTTSSLAPEWSQM